MGIKRFLLILLSISGGFALGFQTIRPAQPVVIEGSELTDLAGAPLTELQLRFWDGNQWQPLPFQFDERDVDGSFFDPDDGLLDANDVLAFQPQDGGVQAALTQWIDDDEAQQNPRIEIEINDPSENATSYVYLYRSATLTPGPFPDQVNYDDVADTIRGATYQMGFDPTGAVQTDFQFRDGDTLDPDILDREKLRISGVAIILPFNIAEDDLTVLNLRIVAGPIRILRRVEAEITIQTFTVPLALDRVFYRRYFEIPPATGTVTLPGGVSLSAIRISRDFNAQASGGTLRDPNNAVLNVDGVAEAGVQTNISPAQQAAYWNEFAMGDFSIWNAMQIAGLATTTNFYYHDDLGGGSADGTPDTGDQMSFGDHGVLFNSPNTGAIQFSFGTFVDQGGNFTPQAIEDYISQPLQSTTASSQYSLAFWEFVALWASQSEDAPDVAFLTNFVTTFGVPPL